MKNIITHGILLLAFVACGKDRTLEDFQREQARSDLAQYKAVEGRYSGMVHLTSNNANIGGLQIVLEARLQPGSSTGGSNTGGTPIGSATMTSELDFQDSRYASVASSSSTYDPSTGTYDAIYTITNMVGTVNVTSTLELKAVVSGNQMVGTLEGSGYKAYGGTFTLWLNGEALDSLGRRADKPIRNLEGTSIKYTGTKPPVSDNMDDFDLPDIDLDRSVNPIDHLKPPKHGHNPKPKPKPNPKPNPNAPKDPYAGLVVLTATYPVITPVEHFFELFLPLQQRTLQLDFRYSDIVSVPFSTANWDTSTGIIQAINNSSVVGADPGPWVQQFNCRNFHFSDALNQPFQCIYSSNRGGPAIKVTFDKVLKE